jgi:hypothetical protein
LFVLKQSHCIAQTGLKLGNPPASAFQVLGLQVGTTTPKCTQYFQCREVFIREFRGVQNWKKDIEGREE